MALINRVSRLFTADLHAVLDRIEEPDVLLRHAIREMDEETADAEQRLKQLDHEHARLLEHQQKVAATLGEFADQLGIALASGNQELGRRLIRRRLEAERLAGHLADRAAAVAKALVEQRAALAAQREQLDVMRQKAELFAARPTLAVNGGNDWLQPGLAVGDDEVEVELLRELQQRKGS